MTPYEKASERWKRLCSFTRDERDLSQSLSNHCYRKTNSWIDHGRSWNPDMTQEQCDRWMAVFDEWENNHQAELTLLALQKL